MDGYMLVALISGILLGTLIAAIRFQQLLVVVYHFPFRTWRPYTALYEAFENGYTYELLGGGKRFKSHKAFLNEYQELRPRVNERFNALWNLYATQVGRDYILVFVIGLAASWGYFWVFAGSFILVQFVAFLYLHFAKSYHADTFASLMISIMLENQRVVKTTDDFIIRSE